MQSHNLWDYMSYEKRITTTIQMYVYHSKKIKKLINNYWSFDLYQLIECTIFSEKEQPEDSGPYRASI